MSHVSIMSWPLLVTPPSMVFPCVALSLTISLCVCLSICLCSILNVYISLFDMTVTHDVCLSMRPSLSPFPPLPHPPHAPGTEPWWFYLANLSINFGASLPVQTRRKSACYFIFHISYYIYFIWHVHFKLHTHVGLHIQSILHVDGILHMTQSFHVTYVCRIYVA